MALIPPLFLNAVVALGQQSPDGSIKSNATGFLYGHPAGVTDEKGQKGYYAFLLTNSARIPTCGPNAATHFTLALTNWRKQAPMCTRSI